MAVFVDTSGIIATLNAQDPGHRPAADRWAELLAGDEPLLATNYILVESFAVLARRLGFEAVRAFQNTIVPVLEIFWVDQAVHESAVAALLTAGDRHLSLVDCVSFAAMRRLGIETAFTLDAHFAQQGFRCIP
ncbi:MAG: PIN domain-containing protein [Chloroflexi bacterium]|nr:PIN domain-containing protein [Chloroflexota bacterium]